MLHSLWLAEQGVAVGARHRGGAHPQERGRDDAEDRGHPRVEAGVLIGERRWNLKLKNGLDVRLPEADVPRALDTLAH